MWETKIVELISTYERRGIGKENDPIRMVEQLWTKDGRLVAELDHAEANGVPTGLFNGIEPRR